MKRTKALAAFLFFLLITAGSFAMQKRTDKQPRSVESFQSIHVSSGIDLYLTQSDNERVSIQADDDIIDDIITEVKNGVLNIYCKKKFNWGWTSPRKAYVSFKELKSIHASAGSDVYSDNEFVLTDLDIKASSGSDIRLSNVTATEISLHTSSGSDAFISGETEHFEARASSGSDLDAAKLKSKSCDVSVSSGSDASVFVTQVLKASASSGGDIRYHGNPKHKDINESSGGDISGY